MIDYWLCYCSNGKHTNHLLRLSSIFTAILRPYSQTPFRSGAKVGTTLFLGAILGFGIIGPVVNYLGYTPGPVASYSNGTVLYHASSLNCLFFTRHVRNSISCDYGTDCNKFIRTPLCCYIDRDHRRCACMAALARCVTHGGWCPHKPRSARQLASHVEGLQNLSQVCMYVCVSGMCLTLWYIVPVTIVWSSIAYLP